MNGEFPFIESIASSEMYSHKLWTKRQYAGFGCCAGVQTQLPALICRTKGPLRGLSICNANRDGLDHWAVLG